MTNKPPPLAPTKPVNLNNFVRNGATEPNDEKRLSIRLPRELHRRVKLACAEQELIIAEVIRELLDKRFPRDAA